MPGIGDEHVDRPLPDARQQLIDALLGRQIGFDLLDFVPMSFSAGAASTNGVSAATIRSKPSWAASLAISSPMPLEAPVMIASLC